MTINITENEARVGLVAAVIISCSEAFISKPAQGFIIMAIYFLAALAIRLLSCRAVNAIIIFAAMTTVTKFAIEKLQFWGFAPGISS